MKSNIAQFILESAGMDFRSPKMKAVDALLLAASIAEKSMPEWWRWTVWLWAALGVNKIKDL